MLPKVKVLPNALAQAVIAEILSGQSRKPLKEKGQAFAPANVALCKYWGKRNNELNLPVTSSLSISLGPYGAKTAVYPIDAEEDSICVNGVEIREHNADSFIHPVISFLNLFRGKQFFRLETETNIPVAAGLASSASGFAALVLALADLNQWQLDRSALSILARLGSGSACRSLWQGFVEWTKGQDERGLDSFGTLFAEDWPSFRVGLLILNQNKKSISSREAMKNTIQTSEFYQHWPIRAEHDIKIIKQAILARDFELLGKTAESNALCMHALMQTARPPIVFSESETVATWHKIWQLRKMGLKLYFTQDAGPNLKLLYLAEDESNVKNLFPGLLSIAPMDTALTDTYPIDTHWRMDI